MPKDLPPDDGQALSNAERQARYRARKAEQTGTTIHHRRPADRRTRLRRWHDAVTELLADSGVMSPAIPTNCRPAFRADVARRSDLKSPTVTT